MPARISLLLFLMGVCLPTLGAASAAPRFVAAELRGLASSVVFCDLDDDRLKDAVDCDGTNLWVSWQGAKGGFDERQRIFHAEKPCVFWPAKMGRAGESLLILDRDGASELWFTNRTTPLTRRFIQTPTAIPESVREPMTWNMTLSLRTEEWPLLLVPTLEGLQLWRHKAEWALEQTLKGGTAVEILPTFRTPGYTRQAGMSLGIWDLNGDGQDDLMLARPTREGVTYECYIQQGDGELRLRQTFEGMERGDWQTWLCWLDINKDGELDLIKSTWPYEPWFVPGARAGKVLLGIYLADGQGRLPAEPQQALRKNDWNPVVPVVDVDGDGFADLVLTYGQFDSRDGLRKMIASRKMDVLLKVFFYRPGLGFVSERERKVSFHVDLQGIEMNLGRPPELERFGNLNGDFNGDGKKDLLVRETEDELRAYFFLSREKGFSEEPDLRFPCTGAVADLETMDLNGDGVSDVVVHLNKGAIKTFLSAK